MPTCMLTQLYPTFWDPVDCSPPGSSAHGIILAIILEWVAGIFFSRGSSWPRDQTHVSCIADKFFTTEPLGKQFISPCFKEFSQTGHNYAASNQETALLAPTQAPCGGLVVKSCPTFCDPWDCRLPGSSIHRIFQARMLEWAAVSFSRGSSKPRDGTWVSCTVGRFCTNWAQAPLWPPPICSLTITTPLTNGNLLCDS